jgi:acyl carrier protein
MTATQPFSEAQIRAAIFSGLRQVAPEADLDNLAPDANLREALDIDSFDFLTFLIGLDEALGVAIPEADYGQLVTLVDITRYLAARLGARP